MRPLGVVCVLAAAWVGLVGASPVTDLVKRGRKKPDSHFPEPKYFSEFPVLCPTAVECLLTRL